MKKLILLLLIITANYHNSIAQQYFTKNGLISFFSSAMLEDIRADNNQVISVINLTTGDIQFSLLNNAFHFKKALMEEHFNDDYIESAKYPKSTFKGTITNLGTITPARDGTYNATVTGDLTIHGVTKNVTVSGKITLRSGQVSVNAVFKVKPRDYNINIPATVKNNIAEQIELTVNCNYEKRN